MAKKGLFHTEVKIIIKALRILWQVYALDYEPTDDEKQLINKAIELI